MRNASSSHLPEARASEPPQDLGMASTMPAPEESIDVSRLPTPSTLGMADAGERDRVFAALFEVPAERRQLGRFVVLGTVGRGAMGTVLEAFDRTLDRRVAVKMLHRDLGERQRQRLLREAQALAKLSHPSVVQVYEVGEAEGQIFIAMELVRGRSLAEWLEQTPRPGWRACVQVFLQAGEGLAAAHAAGLVHRDFKPANAITDDEGRVRVLDFGLARQAEDAERDTSARMVVEPEDAALASSLTRTGTVLGTPAYMPLEQMRGEEVDARSDQFSFCVSLYEALYGERPFDGRSLEALMLALELGKVRPAPKGAMVPEALRRVLLHGLASDPGERWPSMEALLAELRRLVAPHRRAWWALVIASGLAATGAGLWQYAEVGFRCEGAQAQLDGVWDEPRKQVVEAAIRDTGVSFAPDTWARVEQQLDQYAGAWVGKHTEVCEATSVRHEQSAEVMDLRMECLRGRRVALQEAVRVLAQADATRVLNAVQLVTSLPGLSRCDDVEALRAKLPPPEDPQVAQQVQALRERLEQARALQEAGDYAGGLAVAEDVATQAEGLGYSPLLAEAWLRRGAGYERAGRYADAERDVQQAYLLAAELRYDEVEAAAAAGLGYIVAGWQGRYAEGLQFARTALALARGPRVEPAAEGRALHEMGRVLVARAEPTEALTYQERAVASWTEALGPEHPSVASAMKGMGDTLSRQGKLDEAVTHYRSALAIYEQALGPRHPQIGSTHNALCGVLGRYLRAPEKLEEALVHCRIALAIKEETVGSNHVEFGGTLGNIARVLDQQGKLDESLRYDERALAIYEQALGARHFAVGERHIFVGVTLRRLGKHSEARAHFQRGMELLADPSAPSRHMVASALMNMALIELLEDDSAAAREPAERALALYEAIETSPEQLAPARFILAQALWDDPSQHGRARTLIEQARQGYVDIGEHMQWAIDELDAWVAEHGDGIEGGDGAREAGSGAL
jgi:tetratricopeptide (TPR) repeat protein/tRNA A-37 threonylcarbamoyl transferase component Bud32